MIAAVMTERQLVGFGAQRKSQHLLAEADAKERDLAEQSLQCGNGCGQRFGIAGAIGNENSIRVSSGDLTG